MQLVRKLIIAIHDLHPWGGQDKSNLEILFGLSQKIPLEIHAYQFTDHRPWPSVTFIKYKGLRRPMILKVLSYGLRTLFRLSHLRKTEKVWVQSTGTATWDPDVFQIQFLHKTWQNLQADFNLEDDAPFLKSIYHQILQLFNVWLEHRVYKKNKKYIAISHSIKKELMQNFQIPEKNIRTIYHGVDSKYFCPPTTDEALAARERVRNELRIPKDALVLLHTGALNQRKGVPMALETIGVLKAEGFSNIHYLAVGAGDVEPLKKIAADEKISEYVHFIQHSKNIRDYYWASDLFFFPTVYEPFGLVILEAMASGLPCVVSPSAGGSELIDHEQNGLLIENILDPVSMAQQLGSLIKNPDLRKRFATAGVATAQARPWTLVSEEYFQFYQSLNSTIP
jgi:glycosyltransferase involved in cell wall biosynthesis